MANETLLQEASTTIDRDVIVVANAGSGKTHLLVEHYFYLLSQGFSPQEIVAFTFTEKAALELKERILRTLPSHRSFQDLPTDTLEEWKQKVMEAPIGTIHQFCLRVIQDDPGVLKGKSWDILEESAEAQMREDLLRRVLESALSEEDGPARRLLSHYGISPLLRVLRSLLREEYVQDKPDTADFPEALPEESRLLKDIEVLGERLSTQLREIKLREGRISFFDLEQLALERIRNRDRGARRFWTQIQHLLVDEFQDTSPIQIEILEALRSTAPAEAPKLFVVGDPKQSIYRFRHVDQALLEKTAAQILQQGGVQFDFTTNYRSRPAVVNFVNRFAARAFPDSLPSGALPEPATPGEVHFTSLPALPKTASAETYRHQEADWVADQIQNLHASGTPLEEIAVLFRASASSRTLVKKLKERGLPFTLRGGRILWDRQEVRDFKNLLFFLDRPRDSMALLGALRSPLFLVSDETLFWLTQDYRGDIPLWDHLVGKKSPPQAVTPEEREKFLWSLDELRRLQDRFSALRPGALLRELVESWDLRGLYGQIEEDTEPILAMEQFLHYLNGIEGGAAMARLREIQRHPVPVSPLADQLESKSCLQLLTIHAAKGLEFSAVFLMDLDRSPPHPPKDLQSWGKIRALKLREEQEWQETPLFQGIKAAHQAEETEENKRLLYVAMTRAKEHLFLPMSSKSPRKDTLKFLLLENLADFSPEPAPEKREAPPLTEPQWEPAPLAFIPTPGKPRMGRRWATVSEMELFSQCALRHHFAYGENISDQDWTAPGSGPDPADLGTLLHRVLHEWSFHPEKDLGEILPPLLALNPLWNRESLLAQLHEQLEAYRNSSVYAPLLEAGEHYSELPFILKLPHGLIRGQIDRLLKRNDSWLLLDFKSTERPAGGEAMLRHYGFQLKTYALAAQKFLRGIVPDVQIHLLSPPRSFGFRFTESELHAHEGLLNSLLEKSLNPNLDAVKFQELCHHCPYWKKIHLCPVPGKRSH